MLERRAEVGGGLGVGKDAVDKLRSGHVVPVPSADVMGPRKDGVPARPLGIDQPDVLVGPFGGAPLNQPFATGRVDRVGIDGGDASERAVLVDRHADPSLSQEVERPEALVAPPESRTGSLKTPPLNAS